MYWLSHAPQRFLKFSTIYDVTARHQPPECKASTQFCSGQTGNNPISENLV